MLRARLRARSRSPGRRPRPPPPHPQGRARRWPKPRPGARPSRAGPRRSFARERWRPRVRSRYDRFGKRRGSRRAKRPDEAFLTVRSGDHRCQRREQRAHKPGDEDPDPQSSGDASLQLAVWAAGSGEARGRGSGVGEDRDECCDADREREQAILPRSQPANEEYGQEGAQRGGREPEEGRQEDARDARRFHVDFPLPPAGAAVAHSYGDWGDRVELRHASCVPHRSPRRRRAVGHQRPRHDYHVRERCDDNNASRTLRDRKGPGTGGTYLRRERSPGKQGMTFGSLEPSRRTQRQSFGGDPV